MYMKLSAYNKSSPFCTLFVVNTLCLMQMKCIFEIVLEQCDQHKFVNFC